jgi:outer membrane protein OmpA-like peptidoglycan-associated protein
MNQIKLVGACVIACGVLSAQAPLNQSENEARMAAGSAPIYRINVTERTMKAISYRHRGDSTKVDFRGTELFPSARGEARVQSRQGSVEVDATFSDLQPATKFGAEYLTYVMWAITPEGRTANLGEVVIDGTKSQLRGTTELQVFGLIVTAEPYFAVTKPSDLIVMENVIRPDTVGKIEEIDAKFELLKRGQYQRLTNPLALKPDKNVPLELYEARNAVSIARSMGADRFAAETFQKAEKTLAEAEAYQKRKAGRKPVTMTARAAVQTAEDSRAIAVKRQEADAIAAAHQVQVDRAARAETARAAAQSDADRVSREAEAARIRAQAESARLTNEKDAQAAASMAEAERVKRDNEARMAAAAADANRQKLETDARMAANAAEADRLKQANEASAIAAKAEVNRLKLENDARMVAAGAEADRLKRENEAQQAANQANLDRAAKDKAQAEGEKAEMRAQMLKQFNAVLETRDTARGLIVNMSDVLFDTGKFSLRPLAREKLARVAGIVSGHPGMKLEVEGHTDSVGGDAYNQTLSEKRGDSVRDYLTKAGMAESAVTSKGFGKTQPVATNDTAAGRQQNRRVELVISGDVIGTAIGAPIASK